MDKQTYEQIDRIEYKIDLLLKKLVPESIDKDQLKDK